MSIHGSYDQSHRDRDKGPTVLIVDDEVGGRTRVKLLLAEVEDLSDLNILEATNVAEALQTLATQTVHVVLLDKNMGPNEDDPAHNGISSIPAFLQINPHIQIVVITGSNNTQDVVHAMKYGAFGYVTKESPDELLSCQIKQAIKMARLSLDKAIRERLSLNRSSTRRIELPGSSRAIRKISSDIQGVSETHRPVLLLGETGVGKTTVAEAMHAYRKEFLGQQIRHFIPVNLAALPKELVERELFGNDAGAFTGANKLKQGFVELANKGTLFLDEIGECPLDVQAKLLTVLNNGKYFRVGGNTELHSSFKLICATNRDLEQMVKDGTFREDLWMRISTFQVLIPSLRERPEDIPEIAKAIFSRCCAENNVEVSFSDLPLELIEYLVANPPPGNIRGIDNLLSRLLVWSPRDKNGKPILSRWRSTLGLYKAQSLRPERNSFSIKELMTLPIDVFTPDFPGLNQFTTALSDRIIVSAKQKLETNRDVARLLKLSESVVSTRLKVLSAKSENTSRSVEALQSISAPQEVSS